MAGKIHESDFEHFSFNSQNEDDGDLSGIGVIDPAKVIRTALEDAPSGAFVQARSKRSAFMTFDQAATKSFTTFSALSSWA